MKPNEQELKCILFAKQYLRSDLDQLLKKPVSEIAGFNRYNVSSDKTFEQLWSDFGLRDYGVNYWGRGFFTREQKIACIQYWVSELYPYEINILEIEEELQAQAVERRKKYYASNPNGHIRVASPVDSLPREIDRRYGNYCVSGYPSI